MSRMYDVVNALETLLVAETDLRGYFSDIPTLPNWDGWNTLDGPLSSETFRGRLKEPIRPPLPPSQSGNVFPTFDVEAVLEHFAAAAEIFNPAEFPRFRIFWLERIALVQERYGNVSESAEVRWRIYLVCDTVKHLWKSLWTPRHRIVWNKFNPGDKLEPFLEEFSTAFSRSTVKPWPDQHSFVHHMYLCLGVSAERYASAGLVHLAERSWNTYLGLARANGAIEVMVAEYKRMSKVFEELTDAQRKFAMGSFYRVLYVGQGGHNPPIVPFRIS